MSDQQKTMSQRLHDSAPVSGQVIRFLTAATIGVVLLCLSGLTLTGTVIALVIATPVLVLFSPILIPAGIVLFLVTGGFLFAGGCGVAALAALLWIYKYVAGKHPLGSDHLDYARMRIANKARDVKERAKEYGNQGQKETAVERAKEFGNQAQAQKETAVERVKEYGNQVQA